MSSPKHSNILVIYHSDCLDGFGAAWAAFQQFGNRARYVAARFNEPFINHCQGDDIYILDFCYAPEVILKALETAKKITLIDHHLTAQQQFEQYFAVHQKPENLIVQFDLNRSGCVLAWQYFCQTTPIPQILLHIEDRDLWQFKLAGTKEITTALYEHLPLSFKAFGKLKLNQLFAIGKIQTAQFSKLVQRIEKNAHDVKLGEIKGLAANAPSFFASELGHVLAQKSGTFGMTYHFDGRKNQWIFSLRSIGELNVGELAFQFGGGGHVNAAGFSLANNPFLQI